MPTPPARPPGPPASPTAPKPTGDLQQRLAHLSPEERQRVMAALRQLAIQQVRDAVSKGK